MAAVKVLTIKEAINRATLTLEGGFVVNARIEAERIISEATGLARAEFYLRRERELTLSESDFIESAISERLGGKPLQYILGHQQFRHLDLKCRENVLIPRPETELLVEEVLAEIGKLGGPRLILDIGCGTGAIALSIACECNEAHVFASDISPAAIELTEENARLHGLLDRIQVVRSDLFSDLGSLRGRLDAVVSNPPYIPGKEIGFLQREVQFEPRLALDGGEDGLDFYRAIIKQSPEFLKSGGVLLLEIGFGQAPDIVALLNSSDYFNDVDLREDYQGIERVVKARRV